MKAKVKSTGEYVEVTPCGEPMNTCMAFYETGHGCKFQMHELEFEREIDWEQRRCEIAKDVAAIMYYDEGCEGRYWDGNGDGDFFDDEITKSSVRLADALTAELKKWILNEDK